ncbi:MAG: zinc ribbon domain-containing protein [Deltaproteobacteria bacterium]|nr:zinc ribbon domain-containing protein [Deltaproteobacteria bacterium]
MTEKKCAHCSALLSPDSAFCGACGKPVADTAAAPQPDFNKDTPIDTESPTPAVGNAKTMLLHQAVVPPVLPDASPKSLPEESSETVPKTSPETRAEDTHKEHASKSAKGGPGAPAIIAVVAVLALVAGAIVFLLWQAKSPPDAVTDRHTDTDAKSDKPTAEKGADHFVPIDELSADDVEQVLQDGKRLPAISGFKSAKDVVEPFSVTWLTVDIDNPENAGFSLYYASTCGVVSQDFAAHNRARFVAPDSPGICNVTVEAKSANMLAGIFRTISILVSAKDGEEMHYEE